MRSFIFSLVIFSNIIFLGSCKESGPYPSDMVGNYRVTASLAEGVIDKNAIRDSIQTAMEKAEEDIKKAKEEIEKELNLNDIDTTTTEGKIEFAAKKFGKSMADIGVNMGELGKDMGNLFSNLAEDGIGLSESILKNINIDVELLQDGKIKTKGGLISLGLKDATWMVNGDYFLLKTSESDTQDTFKIKDRHLDVFVLEKDKLLITFTKKAE
jgi:hypothetical protein